MAQRTDQAPPSHDCGQVQVPLFSIIMAYDASTDTVCQPCAAPAANHSALGQCPPPHPQSDVVDSWWSWMSWSGDVNSTGIQMNCSETTFQLSLSNWAAFRRLLQRSSFRPLVALLRPFQANSLVKYVIEDRIFCLALELRSRPGSQPSTHDRADQLCVYHAAFDIGAA